MVRAGAISMLGSVRNRSAACTGIHILRRQNHPDAPRIQERTLKTSA